MSLNQQISAQPIGHDGFEPDLAPALDGDCVLAALRRSRGPSRAAVPARVHVERVHFSASRPVLIHYRVGWAGQREAELVLAELVGCAAAAHAETESVGLAKSRRDQLKKGDRGKVIADTALGVVFRPPGLDAKLPGLKLLRHPDLAAEVAAKALNLSHAGRSASVQLRAHRLGKRAVLQVDLANKGSTYRVFLRLRPVANAAGADAFDLHREIAGRLWDSASIAVPPPLAYDGDLGAAIYGALPGGPPEFSGTYGFRSICLGMRALEAFQEIGPDLAPAYHGADEIALLQGWVDRVSQTLPEYSELCLAAFANVSSALAALPAREPTPSHRDFHEGQILIGEDRAGLLDFDTVKVSDPMLDVGNFIAHIRLDGLLRKRDLRAFEQAAALGSRSNRSGADWVCAEAWMRAALLRLGCIYAFTSDGPRVARDLFEAARWQCH